MTTIETLSVKDKFNALSNASHIFYYKEKEMPFKIIDLIETNDSLKAVVELESGEIQGVYTNSKSAIESLKEVFSTFGEKQPFVIVRIKQTSKGLSLYHCEVK